MKILYWFGAIVGLIVITAGVVYTIVNFSEVQPGHKGNSKTVVKETNEVTEAPETIENEDTAEIGGVEIMLPISHGATEEEVIQTMHNMTYQKVRAEKKWGAVPMSKANAEAIKGIIEQSNYERKEELLAIAERWVNRDFSQIAEDHNYFWGLKDGTVGKATGVMTQAEEHAFALNNYKEEEVEKLMKSGDLPK